MKRIEMNKGFRMTSRAVEALMEATKSTLTNNRNFTLYFCNGYTFKSIPEFGRWVLTEINEWMLANGLVDVDIILNAHMGNQPDFKFFSLIEE